LALPPKDIFKITINQYLKKIPNEKLNKLGSTDATTRDGQKKFDDIQTKIYEHGNLIKASNFQLLRILNIKRKYTFTGSFMSLIAGGIGESVVPLAVDGAPVPI